MKTKWLCVFKAKTRNHLIFHFTISNSEMGPMLRIKMFVLTTVGTPEIIEHPTPKCYIRKTHK